MRGDEETLTDYLDGRMAPAEKTAFEGRLAAEPALQRRLRLLRAMRAALKAGARAMPADLKDALKREARARAAKPPRRSWREIWRSALGGSGVGCGLGAVFAAALLTFAVRLALPRKRSSAGAPPPPSWNDAAAAAGLKSLWTDDDGRDRDEG